MESTGLSRPPYAALKWIVLGALLSFAAWRIVAVNLADFYADRHDAALAARALAWVPDHPLALETLARDRIGDDPAGAAELLRQALPASPVRGMTYALLGAAWDKQGDAAHADAAIDAAVRFAPADVDVRLIAAAHALARNDLDGLLRHWSVSITRRPALGTTLFPDLLRLVAHPANRPAFAALLNVPLVWWPGFVRFVADKAEHVNTVGAVYDLSAAGEANRLTGRSLDPVLARFQREGLWFDARLAWMDTLAPEQLNGMGYVFNGGFEAPLSDSGYDWIRGRAGHIVMETAPAAGAGGNKALYVLFRGPRVRFAHLQQILALPPGDFVLRGRARADDLTTNRGLVWVVSCLGSKERLLATSQPVVGRTPWRKFEEAFSVPHNECPAQRLRLQIDARVALDYDAKGQAWFDDIEVVPASPR